MRPLPDALEPEALSRALDREGFAPASGLLDPDACAALIALWDREEVFRKRVVMARHDFGSGEYRYFADPLPKRVGELRESLYAALAPVANRMLERLGDPTRHPDQLEAMRARCRAAGQSQPTPLLLRYGPGDFNCLHRDLYGEVRFPLQVTALLSEPGRDFDGGEFLLVENRPRKQSTASVVPLQRGDGVIFPVDLRPVAGPRGDRRHSVRHGVSRIRRGERFALGVIFHDA